MFELLCNKYYMTNNTKIHHLIIKKGKNKKYITFLTNFYYSDQVLLIEKILCTLFILLIF